MDHAPKLGIIQKKIITESQAMNKNLLILVTKYEGKV